MPIDIDSYINKIINNFKIIEFINFKDYSCSRQPFYKVICTNCNKESVQGLWSIKKKANNRCKHCKKHHCQLPEGEASINALYSSYKRQADNRNYNFNITRYYFIELINQNCYYCNKEPSNTFRNQNNTGLLIYNGIDRKDNNEGYNIDNCVSCCYTCNRCKSDMSYEEFKEWIINVYKNL